MKIIDQFKLTRSMKKIVKIQSELCRIVIRRETIKAQIKLLSGFRKAMSEIIRKA